MSYKQDYFCCLDPVIFNLNAAQYLGSFESAIILSHVIRLMGGSIRDKIELEGKIWTRVSAKEISDFFGCISERKVQRCLLHLTKNKILLRKKINSKNYDSAYWYSKNEGGSYE